MIVEMERHSEPLEPFWRKTDVGDRRNPESPIPTSKVSRVGVNIL